MAQIESGQPKIREWTMLIALPAPQLIEITGPDAVAFAQAQFSSDVRALANGHWQWSAWLSAQGRVRAFFHLLRDSDERLRLLLRGGSATQLRDALARYVLRANLKLRVVDDLRAYAIEHQSDRDDGFLLPAGTRIENNAHGSCIALPGKMRRWLLLRAAAENDADMSAAAQNHWAATDIDAGIVTLAAALEDRLLPDWIGLGDLDAVSVGKGCYPGQEIVARLHFKGGNKRWLQRIAFDADALPTPGTPLGSGEGSEADSHGLLVCSAWAGQGSGIALAVLGTADINNTSILASPALPIRRMERITPQSF
jgi:folate-binding protein YgfZ